MTLVKTIKARDAREHQVYETTPEIRNILVKEEWVYIDYDRCRVKDFLDVPSLRAYRQKLQRKNPMCSHCAGNYDFKDCDKRNDPETCGACKRVNKEATHSVNSMECPAYIRAAEMRISRTSYE